MKILSNCHLCTVSFMFAVFVIFLGDVRASERRLLPDIPLFKQDGTSLNAQSLGQGSPWILLFVNAASPASQSLLNLLSHRQDGYQQKVVIVVIGSSKATQFFIDNNQKLLGVRWLSEREKLLSMALKIHTAPTVYAINESNEINWKLIGLPSGIKIDTLIQQWIQTP